MISRESKDMMLTFIRQDSQDLHDFNGSEKILLDFF